jgi:SLBB domain-containing protein
MKGTSGLLLLLALLVSTVRSQAPGRNQQSRMPSDFEGKKICVVGNVTTPSKLRFRSGITVTQAIKEAGGLPPHKKSNKVRVYSQTTEGTYRIIYVDLEMVRRRPYMDLELQSFDIVEVLNREKKDTEPPLYNPCFSQPLRRID